MPKSDSDDDRDSRAKLSQVLRLVADSSAWVESRLGIWVRLARNDESSEEMTDRVEGRRILNLISESESTWEVDPPV